MTTVKNMDHPLTTNTEIDQKRLQGIDPKIADKSPGAETQIIFDERYALFMDHFSAKCETEKAIVALAVVVDPKIPERPLIYASGNDCRNQCAGSH